MTKFGSGAAAADGRAASAAAVADVPVSEHVNAMTTITSHLARISTGGDDMTRSCRIVSSYSQQG